MQLTCYTWVGLNMTRPVPELGPGLIYFSATGHVRPNLDLTSPNSLGSTAWLSSSLRRQELGSQFTSPSPTLQRQLLDGFSGDSERWPGLSGPSLFIFFFSVTLPTTQAALPLLRLRRTIASRFDDDGDNGQSSDDLRFVSHNKPHWQSINRDPRIWLDSSEPLFSDHWQRPILLRRPIEPF